jgi:hypothetical protein
MSDQRRFRLRTNILGQLILQVSEDVLVGLDVHDERLVKRWRDARSTDLSIPADIRATLEGEA